MTLFDAVLDLAQYAQGVEFYEITAVTSTTQLTCADMSAKLGEYSHGGTCFFLDGDSAGQFTSIKSASNQGIVLQEEMTDTFAVGDRIAVSSWRYFDTQRLVSAINHVLYNYPIMSSYIDEEQVYTPFTLDFTIPDDVEHDIRRIEIEAWKPLPDDATLTINGTTYNVSDLDDPFVVCHYWQQDGDTIRIKPHPAYKINGAIKYWFVSRHGYVFSPKGEISEQVDKDYLRMMASLFLWQQEITTTHKDNVIAVDMFNQAKEYESNLRKKNIPQLNLMKKDMRWHW